MLSATGNKSVVLKSLLVVKKFDQIIGRSAKRFLFHIQKNENIYKEYGGLPRANSSG